MRKSFQVLVLIAAVVSAFAVFWRHSQGKGQVRSVYDGWQPAIAVVTDLGVSVVPGVAPAPQVSLEIPGGITVDTVLITGHAGHAPETGDRIMALYNPANPQQVIARSDAR